MATTNSPSQSQATLQKEEHAMRAALAALADHESQMRSAGQTANTINEDIARNYVAGSSSTFQNRVQDWLNNYNQLMGKFGNLREALQSASAAIDSAEDDANSTGNSWSPESGSTYHALMGH